MFELQGSLFFGTTNQLSVALDPHLKTRRFVILDMRRVRSLDVTAAHLLEQVADAMREAGGQLLFSDLPREMPGGVDARQYLGDLGMFARHGARAFGELDEALEWVEEVALEEAGVEPSGRPALALRDIDLFRGRQADTLAELEACMETRRLAAWEHAFTTGDTGDELYLIRRGAVRIVLPDGAGREHHVATFRRGDFFGEMAFLDRQPRSANAVAARETDLYVLSRARFDTLSEQHRRLGMAVLDGVARALANRLRRTNYDLQALRSG